MSPILYSVLVSASLLGQVTVADAELEQSIRAAIRQLASKEYAEREQASRDLWRHGLAAETALKRAAASRNGEIRVRARRLLRDFRYGILPGTDADTRRMIREFRDGGPAERQAAFQTLVERERVDILERLIRLEVNPQVRRQLLAQLFQNERIVDRFIDLDRIDVLIDAVGDDQDEQWRRSVTIEVMFQPKMLAKLAERGSLAKLLQLIRNEKNAQVRQSMLIAIFRTPGVAIVLAQNELDFVLDTLRAEPDQKVRGSLLSEIFSNSRAAQAIVTHRQLDAILKFSREQTDVASQQKLIERMLASAPVVESLLKDGGIDRVLALAGRETDPIRRGRLLGATIASSTVRSFLQRNGLSELAIKLAKNETDKAARHEFLQALLHDTSFVYSLSNEATIVELWKLIKADADAGWRAQSLIVLLRSHRSNALLKDKAEAAWILRLASDDASGPVREDILRFLLPNLQAQRVLIANGHFETMLSLARKLPLRSRGEILSNFLAGSGVAEHLITTNRTELLIDVAKEESDLAARQLCLQGIFRNSKAMTALLAANHYGTFRDLIQQDTDRARQASLFGSFIQSYQVMGELTKRGDSNLILEYAESKDEAARRQFLPSLFRNHRAVTLLMDEGHFERLAKLAQQDGGRNFDEFLVVPKVIEHLAATQQLSLLLDFAANQADDNTRRNLLRNVFMYQKTAEALIASDSFDRLLRLTRSERDTTWRASLLGPVISSLPVVRHFAENKRLDELFSLISDEPEPVVRVRLTTYLTNRNETLNVLIDHGNLDRLISLVSRNTTGRTRGDVLARVLTNEKALQRIQADQRIGVLLSFVEDEDAAFTAAYAIRLFASTRAMDLLVESGYYGDIFKIATTSHDAKHRSMLIGRLLNSSKVMQQMIARKDVATLVSTITSEGDAASRQNYLATICTNEPLIDEMLKGELFDSFVKVLRSVPDETVRKRQLATLVFTGKAVKKLAADKQLEQIVTDALAETDSGIRETWLGIVVRTTSTFNSLVACGFGPRLLEATETGVRLSNQQSMLRSAFSNQQAMATLIKEGHMDRLLKSAKRHGGSQLDDFLRSTAVIEHLATGDQLAEIINFATEELAANTKRDVFLALIRTEASRKALFSTNNVEKFCAAIRTLPDPDHRGGLLAGMFASMDVAQRYVETKTVDKLLTLIEKEATPQARVLILTNMFGRSDVTNLLIDSGAFEELLRITQEGTTGEARDRLLGQLLTNSKALSKLVADERLDMLLSFSKRDDDSISAPYLSRLFTNRSAVELLIDRGKFSQLYELATASSDSRTSTALLAELLVHKKAIEALVAAEQLTKVVRFAKDESDRVVRRTYVGRLCANQQLVAELAEANLFDALLDECESENDRDERRRYYAALLRAPAAIDIFAANGRLKSLLADSLEEPDASRLQNWLSSLLSNSSAFSALTKHGLMEHVIEVAERELGQSRLQSAYRSMLSNPTVISELAKSGQHGFIIKFLDNETQPSQQQFILSRIASNEDALRAIADAGELNDLLGRAGKIANQSAREFVQRQLLVSHGTVSSLAEQGKLPSLFELIRGTGNEQVQRSCLQSIVFNNRTRSYLAELADPTPFVNLVAGIEDRYRSGVVTRSIFDANMRRRWIEAGNLAHLERLIALSPSESYHAQYRQNLFYTPSGVIGHLLRQENFDAAETLLQKYEGDRAISWVVSYRRSRGQLDAEIKRLGEKPVLQRTEYESRLLVYLLRANGDLAAATEVANTIGNPQLQRPLLVEQQEWAKAAALQAALPLPPPVTFTTSTPQDELTQRLEQLGMAASYFRLGGDTVSFKRAIDEVVELAEANRTNSQFVWNAAQMLLLNDRVTDGLRLVSNSQPIKAFHMLVHRQDYEAAFEVVGIGKPFVVDREWFDALPFDKSSSEFQNRFRFTLEVARQLRIVGRADDAEAILSLLEEITEATPEKGKSPTRNYLWQWYAAGLYQAGLKDRAWAVAAKVTDPRQGYPPNVINDIFAMRSGEARAWWAVFHLPSSLETTEQRLQRIDAVLVPSSPEAIESFSELAKMAIAFGDSGQSEAFWRGIAQTCAAYGERELAIQCYEKIQSPSLDAGIAHADELFDAERWKEAADVYHEAWSQDYDRLGMLFLAGLAKQMAGEETVGKKWQKLADLQAVTTKARYQLALTLAQRGLTNEASEQWKTLLQTAPFESLELNDAARQLALTTYRDKPEVASLNWQHYLLGDVRPSFWLLNETSYLSVTALTHQVRATAAIQRAEFEAARADIESSLLLFPGNTNVGEQLAPLLDAANQSGLADEFVSQVVQHYERLCELYPKSALLHNNLAWAAARSHRQLDKALLHAERAVELAPTNAGYVDTLAEVHFQLGDRDEAVRISERSVALRPLGKSLQEQLTRFRSAPLPSR